MFSVAPHSSVPAPSSQLSSHTLYFFRSLLFRSQFKTNNKACIGKIETRLHWLLLKNLIVFWYICKEVYLQLYFKRYFRICHFNQNHILDFVSEICLCKWLSDSHRFCSWLQRLGLLFIWSIRTNSRKIPANRCNERMWNVKIKVTETDIWM